MNTPRPLVCVTVTARDTAELRARRDAAVDADLVELRIDSVEDPDIDRAIGGRRAPVVVTCRRADDGGWYRGDEGSRRALLAEALTRGAEYVDLEWGRGFDAVVRERSGRNIVLSLHDFQGVPNELEARVESMMATGAEVVKVAVTVSKLADCERLSAIARRHAGRRMVLIAMGEAGIVTRVFPARFGSCWTYAGPGVAPGQIALRRLLDEYRFRRIGPATALYGIFGQPVGHSLSPAIHNAAFEQLGIDAAYIPLAAADGADLFEALGALDVAGASVTAPFKEVVIPGLAVIDGDARRVGAVNTLVNRAGAWHGFNTDVEGFLAGCAGAPLAGRRLAVLGTGGAARAVAMAARRAGASVTCYGRNRGRADALAAALDVGGALRPVPAGSWDVLVNATPVGTHPDVDVSAFPDGPYDGGLAYDLVYNPPLTRFLRDASAGGCRTIGGLDMLIAQARRQVELWTGRVPDPGSMREAAEQALARQAEQS